MEQNGKLSLDGISKSISSTTPSLIILLLIGALAGTWLLSGIVPAMIYYGLQILSPEIFLFATAIITAIVSLSTGSSWSTIATIGIALLGIGQALGMPTGLLVEQSFQELTLGIKCHHLSDTTNFSTCNGRNGFVYAYKIYDVHNYSFFCNYSNYLFSNWLYF